MLSNHEMAGVTVSRKFTHEQKVSMGFVAVEVNGRMEYLTPMQERFCRFWVLDPGAPSKAAWLAGYGENCKTDTQRWQRCYCNQYQLRKMKKIANRYLELKKLSDRGVNITPEG